MTTKDEGTAENAEDLKITTVTASFDIPADRSTLTPEEAKTLKSKIASAITDINAKETKTLADSKQASELLEVGLELKEMLKTASKTASASDLDDDEEEEKEEVKEEEKTVSSEEADPEADVKATFDATSEETADEDAISGEEIKAEDETPVTASRVYVASANTQGHATGDKVNFQDLAEMFSSKLNSDVKTYVASAPIEGVPVTKLTGDAAENTKRILSIPTPRQVETGEKSHVASGFGFNQDELARTVTAAWGCTPQDVIRQLQSCNASGRTLLNEFRQTVTDKLNPLLLSKGTVDEDSISVRTAASDAIDPDDADTWKPCPAWTCGPQRQVLQNEVISCMRVTEQEDFNNPEAVADGIETLNRRAEIRAERLLTTDLDATLSHYTHTSDKGGAALTQGIAGSIYQIVQAANYENLNGYVLAVDSGLLELLYAEEAGRNYSHDDIKAAASALLNVFDLPVVTLIGGANPSLADVTLNAVGAGAVALPSPANGGSNTWRVRLFNPDRYSVIRNQANDYSAGPVINDLDLLRQNQQAIFGRFYEGLADFGQCPGIKLDVTVCLDSNRRVADSVETCES